MSDLTTSFNGLSIDPAKYRRIANATGACNIIERIDGNDINTGNAAIERKDEALLWIYLAAVDKGVKEELLGKATERATFLKNLPPQSKDPYYARKIEEKKWGEI